MNSARIREPFSGCNLAAPTLEGNPGDPIGRDNPVDVFEEAIPPQFNKETTLTGEIKLSGSNTFDFDLKSK